MAGSLNTPDVLTQPIAENGDKNTIPATNDQSLGQMSQSTGFPEICSERIADGGKAPRRADFNGAFNMLSRYIFFKQNGGIETFRADVSTAIGGYPKDAILGYSTSAEFKLVRSLVANNTYNFNTNPSYIDDGTHWESVIPMSKNIANWSSNVSNCIIEIPQDIKLELNNGTLTLKAGSKAYLPVGTTYSASQDVVVNNSQFGTATSLWVVAMTGNDVTFPRSLSNCVSGAGATTVAGYAYDTTTNIISWYSAQGSVGGTNCSFPIAIIHTTNGTPDRIDQVFNGLGYIGSTVFSLPGIKGLISNGINEDGTLKNIIYSLSSVATGTITETGNIVLISNGTMSVSRLYAYNAKTNYVYNTNTGTNYTNRFICGSVEFSNNTVTSFVPKQVFHAADYNDLINIESKLYYPDLFDAKWSDHLINSTSWVHADSFSWQSGTTYSNAYAHLVADISGKTLQSETIGGVTVQFYLANDGHKICPAAQETNVSSIYTATGVAWYYILDTANTRFKLPRTKFGLTGYRDTVGKYVEPGLPNITGSADFSYGTLWPTTFTGALYNDTGNAGTRAQGEGGTSPKAIKIDASLSSAIYGNSTTVQPAATQMYLYFYVGQFAQSALENTAGLNASLFNGKADINLLNTANNVDFVIERQEPNAGNDYTWYRKYKSGWVEQGGKKSSQTDTVTLLISMSDTNYMILTDLIGTASWDSYRHDITNITTTGFYCSYDANQNDPTGFYWEVKGMGA